MTMPIASRSGVSPQSVPPRIDRAKQSSARAWVVLASLQAVAEFAVAHVRLLAFQVDRIAGFCIGVQFYDLASGDSSTMTSMI